jgi:hypothetical protein
VQSERQWDPETVLFLGAGLMLSIASGVLVNLVMLKLSPDLTVAQQTYRGFIILSVSQQIVPLILIHFFLRLHGLTWTEFLDLKRPGLWRALALALAALAVVLPVALGLNKICEILLTQLTGKAEPQSAMKTLEISLSLPQRTYFAFSAIVLAPLFEETLFRALLYRGMKQRGSPGLALFGSAFLFGCFHFNLLVLVPLTVFGIIMALLYDHADHLMAPIVAHSLFNAANFTLYFHKDEAAHWLNELVHRLQQF